MKQIMILIGLFMLFTTAKSRTGEDVITDLVFSQQIVMDSNEVKFIYFDVPSIYSDTLSFVIEVTKADSLRKANPNTGDSLDIEVKILPKSPGGYYPHKDTSNYLLVVDKIATAGRVSMGTNVPLLPSQQYGARATLKVKGLFLTKQSAYIKIYTVRKFNNVRG